MGTPHHTQVPYNILKLAANLCLPRASASPKSGHAHDRDTSRAPGYPLSPHPQRSPMTVWV